MKMWIYYVKFQCPYIRTGTYHDTCH